MGFALFSDRHLTYKKAGPCRPLFPKWVVRFFKPNFDIRGEYLQNIHQLATHGRFGFTTRAGVQRFVSSIFSHQEFSLDSDANQIDVHGERPRRQSSRILFWSSA
jgi:hypothetical protein